MIFLYNIFIFLFGLGIRITTLWSPKAKEWLKGRRSLFKELELCISETDAVIWIHSSSAGEFEQAKPVIENLKTKYPAYKIVVTLFSPSGYSVAKRYSFADQVYYLPLDTAANARRFLKLLRPQLVIFVKYDFWYHHLQAVKQQKIPLLLISSVFNSNQSFFKWYGSLYRKMLFFFDHIFVQDKSSLQQLHQYHITNCSVSGDTRFDRVLEIADNFREIDFIPGFINNEKVLVAGSTWPDDESSLKQVKAEFPQLKMIIAPHEINTAHIEQLQKDFPDAICYSQLSSSEEASRYAVLIIDNVGMLSRLYRYATFSYIGGGFTRDGIHNTLEAAVFGRPVIFGPNYQKYREAKELILHGGGFSFQTTAELITRIHRLLSDNNLYQSASESAKAYVYNEAGATNKIMHYIQENRLLTN